MAVKPIGGISRVCLRVALHRGGLLANAYEAWEVVPLEDRSHYSEHVEWVGSMPTVRHRLTLVTEVDAELSQEPILLRGLRDGFYAIINFNNGRMLTFSEEPGARPFRLVSSSVDMGTSPMDRPSQVWVFESIDNLVKI